jgi:acyl-CoA synthetase (AMP-forming)/AMP-acid ligase II
MNFGVPMARAVLNSINSRLDARTISVLLNHSQTKVLFVDSQFLQIVQEALRIWFSSPDAPAEKPQIVVIEDRLDAGRISFKTFLPGWGELVEYEELLQSGDPAFPIQWPLDDWETISLNYTSGTTSRPKGVLYHHRYSVTFFFLYIDRHGLCLREFLL